MLHVALLAQLAIVAHAPDTVYACDPIELTVAVSAPGTDAARLVTPTFGSFSLLRGSSAQQRVRNGPDGRSVLSEYRFTVTTDRAGRFVVPAFEARLGDESARSEPVSINVKPLRTRGLPAVVTRARIDTSMELELRAVAQAETVYVGQQATYEVAVFLNQRLRGSLRRNPTFYPPEMQAMLAYDLPTPNVLPRERVGTRCFDALVYRRALFPLVPGRIVIPPAQLVYSTGMSSSSLFSREESHELQTDSVTIVAVEPPQSGRPGEYSGAVGDLRVEAAMDSVPRRVGDPLLLTVRVSGSGNVKLFPRPAVEMPWAALVVADERVRVDSTSARISGVKEFDWVLTPRIAGEFDMPSIKYGYFDPSRGRYEIAATPGTRVRIASGTLASSDTSSGDATLNIRTRYRGPAGSPLHSSPWFWLLMALVPFPAIAKRWKRRELPTRSHPQRYDPVRALSASASRDPMALRRHFVKAVAHRLGCNAQAFTHAGALEHTLRRAGVSDQIAARSEELLRRLDAAAYGRDRSGSSTVVAGASEIAVELVRAIDDEALPRSEVPIWTSVLIVALSLAVGAGAIVAQRADQASAYFARGVSAYLRQDFALAREAFAATATLESTAPDAWANFGTASWAVGDTASAALGWRQTLALQPTAADVRSYASLLHGEGPLSGGWVAPLPRSSLTFLFAALWLFGWGLAWLTQSPRRAVRGLPWLARVPLPMVVCALLFGLGSIELETRTSGTRLAVVRRTISLTSDPAIGMDRGPVVGAGEIVHMAGRRGVWTRVEATSGRSGWIASSELYALADRRVP